jgi:DNA-directed RNA polymerase subunit RPC12/RpoP
MKLKYRCTNCRNEVVAEYYTSERVVGFYSECPVCEIENEVFPDGEPISLDTWGEEDLKEEVDSAIPIT